MDVSLGLNIRKIRELKDFSQQYIADKLSISQSSYSDIENGKVLLSEKRLEEIASVLEVSPEVIKGFSEQVIFNSCVQSGYINTNNIQNPLEKQEELYEEIIFQLKERIKVLEERIEELKKSK